jgi:DNA-binding transcriptional MerR regulator
MASARLARVAERDAMEAQGMRKIGDVAAQVGLSLRTVRYYEEVGLVLPSGRTGGGFRLYTDEDAERLALVKRLRPLEFTLEELRGLLHTRDRLQRRDVDEDELADLLDRLAGYAEAARQRCERLREELTNVEAVTEALEAQVRAASGTPSRGMGVARGER